MLQFQQLPVLKALARLRTWSTGEMLFVRPFSTAQARTTQIRTWPIFFRPGTGIQSNRSKTGSPALQRLPGAPTIAMHLEPAYLMQSQQARWSQLPAAAAVTSQTGPHCPSLPAPWTIKFTTWWPSALFPFLHIRDDSKIA